jgi:hypothetical protein
MALPKKSKDTAGFEQEGALEWAILAPKGAPADDPFDAPGCKLRRYCDRRGAR